MVNTQLAIHFYNVENYSRSHVLNISTLEMDWPLLCLYCYYISSGFRLFLFCYVCMPGLAPLRPALPRAHDGPGARPQRCPRHRQAGEAHLYPQTDDNDCRTDVQGETDYGNFVVLLYRGLRVWISFGSPSRMRLMRSGRVVRASDSQCRSRNCPGFDPSILRHSGI
jgi:hypothetical protein